MILTANNTSVDQYKGNVAEYEFATDVTTSSGADLPYVGGTASESNYEPEQRLTGFLVRDTANRLKKVIWCIAPCKRSEFVRLLDIELTDTPGLAPSWPRLEDSAATETFSPSEGTPHPTPLEARTPLGRRLREIRRRIESSGAPLLDWDGIDREQMERRGHRNSG